MGKRRRRSNPDAWWKIEVGGMPVWGILGTLVLVAGMAVGTLVAMPQTSTADPNRTPRPVPSFSFSSERPAIDRVAFSEAWTLLDQTDRPFAIALVGDSTANGKDEWAHLVFERIAQETDRPLVEHWWDIAANSYTSETRTNDDAPNAPIVLWNGSASGMNTDYSAENLTALAPQAPDIVIVNHGHNVNRTPGVFVDNIRGLGRAIATRYPQAGFAFVLQNPRTDAEAEAVATAVAALRENLAASEGILALDIESSYAAAGDLGALLNPDGLHPNGEGSEIAADYVYTQLAAQ